MEDDEHLDVCQNIEMGLKRQYELHAVRQNVRKVVLRRFPHSHFYEIVGEAVHVVAVAHQRRRPGYRRHRTE